MTIGAGSTPVWAQESGEVPTVAVPALNLQQHHLPVDAEGTLWTDDTSLGPDHYVEGRLAFSYMNDPLVYRYQYGDGPEKELRVISDVLIADLITSYNFRFFRVGLDVPLVLVSKGEQTPQGAGIGDIALDLKGVALDREGGAPLGLAFSSRFAFPTGTREEAALAAPGLTWDLGAIVDHQFGPVLVVGNLGTRGQPGAELDGVTWKGNFYLRAGGAWFITEDAGVSLDLGSGFGYGNPLFTPESTPIEGFLGGFGRVSDLLVLRGGLGAPFTSGLGVPDLRAIAALGIEPPKVRDRDGDGIEDRADQCRDQPEDKDLFKDEDGCPDPSQKVKIVVLDHLDEIIYDAHVSLKTEKGNQEGGGEWPIDLHPGEYVVAATADRYEERRVPVVVQAQETTQEFQIKLAPTFGEVRVVVETPDGQTVAGWAQVEGESGGRISANVARMEANPGERSVVLRVEGYQVKTVPVVVRAGESTEVRVILEPVRAVVTAEKIEILEKVFFDVGKTTIRPESFALLDEVSALLVAHPEILKIQVEGHTDAQGSAKVNTRLSQGRAEAVVAYLASKGVNRERMVGIGFGPSKPLDPAKTPEAYDKNRRVEFVILERTPAP
jgi:OOP family OmpA-OmpF porin